MPLADLTLPPPPLAPHLALPPPHRLALFLDIDGTLLDFAPAPRAVHVPPTLPPTLLAWRHRLEGALAFVTGRVLESVDRILPNLATAVAVEHGAAIRHAPEGPLERPDLPSPPLHWHHRAATLAAAHDGVYLERKPRGFALHYRAAPHRAEALHAGLADLVAEDPHRFHLLRAHLAWEIRPLGANKGTAIRQLLTRPPFAGRLPVFVGDDVTDEDGIEAANALGGIGLHVGRHFGSPAAVRAWLA